ncbi:hypothetical protein L3Q82_008193 [Scortum barcoo]|uniref:Uncharacterized protein n=1 Tax=Scortum barcoo TaxID=214431 RepID=A0ACB8WI30_9TELE|nr:hypothetical protein L3Q82_008193 [Scortum barcoo]
MKRTGESVTREINCSHKTTSFQRIYWYKQDEHKALKLLGYLNVDTPYPENDNMESIIIQQGVLRLSVFVLWMTGSKGASDTNSVLQTPPFIIKRTAFQELRGESSMFQLPEEEESLLSLLYQVSCVHGPGQVRCDVDAQELDIVDTLNCFPVDEERSVLCPPGPPVVHYDLFGLAGVQEQGDSNTNSVLQTPPFIIKRTGESVTSEIKCSHKTTSFNQILWYKQDEHKALKFLGYLNVGSPLPEDDVKEKISFDGDGREKILAELEEVDMDIIIIKQGLFTLSVFLLWPAGLIEGSDVNQPDILWKNQSDEATIKCNHTKGVNYYLMYWFRQLPGETIRQIVFTLENEKPDFEPDFKNERFDATKPDVLTGTLILKNLQPGDKGLYFCAVPLSVTRFHQTPADMYKKPAEKAELNCKHSNEDFNRILWYKKTKGQLQFLGYMVTDSDSGLSLHLAQSTIMIPAAPIRLSAALLCVVGLIDASFVTQTPRLWGAEGQSVTMNCSHTKDITHIQMYWYRQLPGEGMKQIVLTTPTPPHSYESGFGEDKFPAEKTSALTGSLTVKKLLPQDSGVYFCAISWQTSLQTFSTTRSEWLKMSAKTSCQLQSVVPTCFKETIIVPKKLKILCLNDYHPVALISTIMKWFECLVKSFITSSLPDSLDPLQFAYRPSRLTEDAIALTLPHCPLPPGPEGHICENAVH